MWLDCGPHGPVPLSRACPKMVVARDAQAIPACNAVLVAVVDGERITRPVRCRGFNHRRAALVRPAEREGK